MVSPASVTRAFGPSAIVGTPADFDRACIEGAAAATVTFTVDGFEVVVDALYVPEAVAVLSMVANAGVTCESKTLNAIVEEPMRLSADRFFVGWFVSTFSSILVSVNFV